MDLEICCPETALQTSSEQTQLQHELTGHICPVYVSENITNGPVLGLEKFPQKLATACEFCALGKKTAQPHPSTLRSQQNADKMAYFDLAGPMPVSSLSEAVYFLVCRDVSSRFRMAYFLKTKDEAFPQIINFINFIQKQTGNPLCFIQTDNGTEFINHRIAEYTSVHGIIHQVTPPYTP